MVDLIWLTPPVIAGGSVFVVLCIMLALWRLKRGQHRQSETLRQQFAIWIVSCRNPTTTA